MSISKNHQLEIIRSELESNNPSCTDLIIEFGKELSLESELKTTDTKTAQAFANILSTSKNLPSILKSAVPDKKITLAEMLLNIGNMTATEGDHRTALKIYKCLLECGLPLEDTLSKTTRRERSLSLMALGSHRKAVKHMSTEDIKAFYGNNSKNLEALILEYKEAHKSELAKIALELVTESTDFKQDYVDHFKKVESLVFKYEQDGAYSLAIAIIEIANALANPEDKEQYTMLHISRLAAYASENPTFDQELNRLIPTLSDQETLNCINHLIERDDFAGALLIYEKCKDLDRGTFTYDFALILADSKNLLSGVKKLSEDKQINSITILFNAAQAAARVEDHPTAVKIYEHLLNLISTLPCGPEVVQDIKQGYARSSIECGLHLQAAANMSDEDFLKSYSGNLKNLEALILEDGYQYEDKNIGKTARYILPILNTQNLEGASSTNLETLKEFISRCEDVGAFTLAIATIKAAAISSNSSCELQNLLIEKLGTYARIDASFKEELLHWSKTFPKPLIISAAHNLCKNNEFIGASLIYQTFPGDTFPTPLTLARRAYTQHQLCQTNETSPSLLDIEQIVPKKDFPNFHAYLETLFTQSKTSEIDIKKLLALIQIIEYLVDHPRNNGIPSNLMQPFNQGAPDDTVMMDCINDFMENQAQLSEPDQLKERILCLLDPTRAHDLDLLSQAYQLFTNAFQADFSQNDLKKIYTYLKELLESGAQLSNLDSLTEIIAYLINHPQNDITRLITIIMEVPQLTEALRELTPLISNKLKKNPALLMEYYEYYLQNRGNRSLLPEELNAIFVPLINWYHTEKLNALAVDRIQLEIKEITGSKDLKTPAMLKVLEDLLLKVQPQALIRHYESQLKMEIEALLSQEKPPLLSEESIKSQLTSLIHLLPPASAKKKLKETIALFHAHHGPDSAIITLCDLLLSITPKDPDALFCRGIAKYRQSTAVLEVFGTDAIERSTPSIQELHSSMQDLQQAYKTAPQKTKLLYLFAMHPILQEHPILQKQYKSLLHKMNTLLKRDVTRREPKFSVEAIDDQEEHIASEKDKHSRSADLTTPLSNDSTYSVYMMKAQRMFPYLFNSSSLEDPLLPDIFGIYDYELLEDFENLTQEEITESQAMPATTDPNAETDGDSIAGDSAALLTLSEDDGSIASLYSSEDFFSDAARAGTAAPAHRSITPAADALDRLNAEK